MARTKAEQREATRAALVQHARDAFAADGYAETSLVDVCRAAGVPKGALYHHFDGKPAILRAVPEQIHEEVADLVAASAPDADPWTQLLAGCETFLVAGTTPPGPTHHARRRHPRCSAGTRGTTWMRGPRGGTSRTRCPRWSRRA